MRLEWNVRSRALTILTTAVYGILNVLLPEKKRCAMARCSRSRC